MATRTITIVVAEDNHFSVHEGERFNSGLTWDELLGQVALLTMPPALAQRPGQTLFRMESADDMLARAERHHALRRSLDAAERAA